MKKAIPANNGLATPGTLHTSIAVGTPLPSLLLSKLPKYHIVSVPPHPALRTAITRVPWNLTLKAEEPLALGALGLLRVRSLSPAALVHHQLRTIPIWAVGMG